MNGRINKILKSLGLVKKTEPAALADTNNADKIACCGEQVHIAYRGLADDRLYLSRDRKWLEVRFFKENGLRVFCAKCRHRVL